MKRAHWASIAVLICIALALGFALILTRRSAERARLQDLRHQAALIAESARTSVYSTGIPQQFRHELQRQREVVRVNRNILPVNAQELLRHGEPAQGTIDLRGVAYYFAARPVNPGTLILLRRR